MTDLVAQTPDSYERLVGEARALHAALDGRGVPIHPEGIAPEQVARRVVGRLLMRVAGREVGDTMRESAMALLHRLNAMAGVDVSNV